FRQGSAVPRRARIAPLLHGGAQRGGTGIVREGFVEELPCPGAIPAPRFQLAELRRRLREVTGQLVRALGVTPRRLEPAFLPFGLEPARGGERRPRMNV